MGKRILQLYANDEDISLAKSKGINLSLMFREFLAIELNAKYTGKNKDKIISELKNKMTKLSGELTLKLEEIEKLKKKVENKKGVPFVPRPY